MRRGDFCFPPGPVHRFKEVPADYRRLRIFVCLVLSQPAWQRNLVPLESRNELFIAVLRRLHLREGENQAVPSDSDQFGYGVRSYGWGEVLDHVDARHEWHRAIRERQPEDVTGNKGPIRIGEIAIEAYDGEVGDEVSNTNIGTTCV